jgi:hypothetical protein
MAAVPEQRERRPDRAVVTERDRGKRGEQADGHHRRDGDSPTGDSGALQLTLP